MWKSWDQIYSVQCFSDCLVCGPLYTLKNYAGPQRTFVYVVIFFDIFALKWKIRDFEYISIHSSFHQNVMTGHVVSGELYFMYDQRIRVEKAVHGLVLLN